jgi:hypothetical protein
LRAAGRQLDETLDFLRHADERVHRLAVLSARELQREGEAEIGDEGERMRRIDGQRREQRKHVAKEILFQPVPLGLLQMRAIDQRDADRGEFRPELDPALLLVACERRHRFADARELLGGREAVWALRHDALPHLTFQAGDAHHEKFVEVVGRYRQEAHPLQQRMMLVGRLLQHPAIEMQPGQFAVDETLRTGAQQRLGRGGSLRGGPLPLLGRGDFLNRGNGLSAINHFEKVRKNKCLADKNGGWMTIRARTGPSVKRDRPKPSTGGLIFSETARRPARG